MTWRDTMSVGPKAYTESPQPVEPAITEQSGNSVYVSRQVESAPRPLSEETKQRLRSVVYKLTRDCVRWYRDDQDVLEVFTDEQLERSVCDYLCRRDYYQQMQGGGDA